MCQILCAWEACGGLMKMWEAWWYPRCCVPSKLPGAARAPSHSGAAEADAVSLVAPDRLPVLPLETSVAAHCSQLQLSTAAHTKPVTAPIFVYHASGVGPRNWHLFIMHSSGSNKIGC